MTLAPDVAEMLTLFAAAPATHTQTVEDARASFRVACVDLRRPDQVPEVASVEDTVVAGRPARVYRPVPSTGSGTASTGTAPELVEGARATGTAPELVEGARATVAFLHGGGYVIGDLDTHDALCRRIARDCDAVVVSSDYRLAPENPFPAPVEDALAFVREVHADRASYGGSDVVAVAGDSAGGNLASICAQQLKDLPLSAQLLIYPAVDFGTAYPSLKDNAEGYGLELATMAYFVQHYVGDRAHDGSLSLDDPMLAPIRGDLTGVAPAVVVVAGYDPLRDEGRAYAEKLRSSDVPTTLLAYDDQIHGFACYDHLCPSSDKVVTDFVGVFADVLGVPSTGPGTEEDGVPSTGSGTEADGVPSTGSGTDEGSGTDQGSATVQGSGTPQS